MSDARLLPTPRVRASALGAAILLTGCLSGSPASPDAPAASSASDEVSIALPEPIEGEGSVDDLGAIVLPVQPRWGPGADAQGMLDDWAEHPVILEPPVPVSVLSGPDVVDGEEWYQVYVLPDSLRWPSDFTAWVPAEVDGQAVLHREGSRPCPVADISGLASLSPFGRAWCFGDRSIELVARSWHPGDGVAYAVDPGWLGNDWENLRSVSLFGPGGGEFPRPPDTRIDWIDARIPPDVELPPLDTTLRVTGHFDHREAIGCRRIRQALGAPIGGVPEEPAAAAETWCRGQFVVTSWEVVLGPERRPPVAADVQLHRTSFEGGECAGVGMEPMRFRMDPDAADPIWLEGLDGSFRSMPVFGPGFRAAFQPDLVVVGPGGEVVARDGTPLNPDAPLGPYFVCPSGVTVTITR